MHKKLMTAAVAGALMAPAMAFAATANVDIYGYFNAEYGFVNQPADAAGLSRPNTDAFNSGASRIGVRGQENLGGGMSAFYQCESQVNGLWSLGEGQSGWCNRNSAVGLKGGFGSVFFGRWDSPIKRASGPVRMLDEAGWSGAQHMLLQFLDGDVVDFSDRNTHSINYDSPNLGGFTFNAQVTSATGAVDSTATDGNKGRRIGFGGSFKSGPLMINAGYGKHDDNAVTVGDLSPGADGTLAGVEETAWLIGATYKWGNWEFGALYANVELDDASVGGVGTLERKSMNFAVEYDLAGPGMIRAGITLADDFEGTALAGLGIPASNTGAKQWQVGYFHSFSKRTTGALQYVRLDNDSNGTYNFTNLDDGNVNPGDNAGVFVVRLIHSF